MSISEESWAAFGKYAACLIVVGIILFNPWLLTAVMILGIAFFILGGLLADYKETLKQLGLIVFVVGFNALLLIALMTIIDWIKGD